MTLPNCASHVFVYCAELQINDQKFWDQFDNEMLQLLKRLGLNQLASIGHAFTIRLQNQIAPSEELTGALLRTFLVKYNKFGSYDKMSIQNKKYVRMTIKSLTLLIDEEIKAEQFKGEAKFEAEFNVELDQLDEIIYLVDKTEQSQKPI